MILSRILGANCAKPCILTWTIIDNGLRCHSSSGAVMVVQEVTSNLQAARIDVSVRLCSVNRFSGTAPPCSAVTVPRRLRSGQQREDQRAQHVVGNQQCNVPAVAINSLGCLAAASGPRRNDTVPPAHPPTKNPRGVQTLSKSLHSISSCKNICGESRAPKQLKVIEIDWEIMPLSLAAPCPPTMGQTCFRK